MSARFVKLTGADGEPRWIRAEAIVDFRQHGQDEDWLPRLTCIDCLGGYSPSVTETPEEILALLAEPPSVEVTEDAMIAAIEAYEVACPRPHVPSHAGLKAAIEAAISEMGLR